MGLRINTNVTAVRALRNLRINDRNQAGSLERLSTGLRIVRASDDPSGLVISEQLRAQVSSLNQAVDNSQAAANLISTADSALGELSDLLIQIRDSVTFALNTGPSSPEQIEAEQDAVDQAISAIDRIANTTRFADSALLNGNRAIEVLANSSELNDLNVRSVSFAAGATSATYNVQVTRIGSAATLSMTSFGVPTGSSISLRITGPRGTADITVAGSTGDESLRLQSAVNRVAGFTGIIASAVGGTVTRLRSAEPGDDQVISLQVIDDSVTATSTNINGTAVADLANGQQFRDEGTNYEVSVNGVAFEGRGRQFSIVNQFLDAEFSLEPGAAAATYTFRVRNSGMFFQLNSEPLPTDGIQVGVRPMNTATLGFEEIADIVSRFSGGEATANAGGFLSSLRTGADNDLVNDPTNAALIVGEALNSVNATRGFLGAIQAQTLEPNIDALGVAIENLQASESSIRDLDFAEETSTFTRNQILFQAGTAVLASANLIPQTVLTLLR
ncbi:MAG: flagellin [Planctomycetota bacterium]